MKPILMNTEMPEEIWKPIKGYENGYLISNYGRVKSLDAHYRSHFPKIMKPWQGNKKYLYITLNNGKNKKTFAIHRLVLDTFVEENPGGKQCAHYDGNPQTRNWFSAEWKSAEFWDWSLSSPYEG